MRDKKHQDQVCFNKCCRNELTLLIQYCESGGLTQYLLMKIDWEGNVEAFSRDYVREDFSRALIRNLETCRKFYTPRRKPFPLLTFAAAPLSC